MRNIASQSSRNTTDSGCSYKAVYIANGVQCPVRTTGSTPSSFNVASTTIVFPNPPRLP